MLAIKHPPQPSLFRLYRARFQVYVTLLLYLSDKRQGGLLRTRANVEIEKMFVAVQIIGTEILTESFAFGKTVVTRRIAPGLGDNRGGTVNPVNVYLVQDSTEWDDGAFIHGFKLQTGSNECRTRSNSDHARLTDFAFVWEKDAEMHFEEPVLPRTFLVQ